MKSRSSCWSNWRRYLICNQLIKTFWMKCSTTSDKKPLTRALTYSRGRRSQMPCSLSKMEYWKSHVTLRIKKLSLRDFTEDPSLIIEPSCWLIRVTSMASVLRLWLSSIWHLMTSSGSEWRMLSWILKFLKWNNLTARKRILISLTTSCAEVYSIPYQDQ